MLLPEFVVIEILGSKSLIKLVSTPQFKDYFKIVFKGEVPI